VKRLLVLAALLAAGAAAQEPRRSAYLDMGPSLRAMQDDDAANPASLWVLEGEALWARKDGRAERACADCHGAPANLAGVAARYPAFDPSVGKPIDLAGKVEQCRTERQGAEPWPRESRPALAIEALLARQSRGTPLAAFDDSRLAPAVAQGELLWRQRFGQLDLACAQCHEDRAGLRLGGSAIPQGHPTGYPVYRLEWQSLGSLQRRLRNCMTGVRAESFAYGSDEFTVLELFLKRRAAGMVHEGTGVRP
jgi:L-cysteine S-thiosulfotransferase